MLPPTDVGHAHTHTHTHTHALSRIHTHTHTHTHHVTTVETTTKHATIKPILECPECGTLRNGKLSCCGSGGTWFNKCGNPGDAKFDRTWSEGIQACKSKFMSRVVSCIIYFTVSMLSDGQTPDVTTTSPVVVTDSPGVACPKCGVIKKSGQLSCCVRGGAWFKKCGSPGDARFDHTWLEGIQACESKLVAEQIQMRLRL